jgi:hypothetical protein
LFQSGQRRSERVLMDMPVVVRGKSAGQLDFQEETFTVTVSAHGALVMLAARVALGQELVLVNPQNSEQREGRVAYLGAAHAGLAQVAVEFYKPAPEFWPIYPPPADWNSA